MWEKIEGWFTRYCIALLTGFMILIEKLPPVVSIGLPLLITAMVQWFLPRWASITLAALVWIPAAAGAIILLVGCWPHLRQRRYT